MKESRIGIKKRNGEESDCLLGKKRCGMMFFRKQKPEIGPTMLEMLKQAEKEEKINFERCYPSKGIGGKELDFLGGFGTIFDETLKLLTDSSSMKTYLHLYIHSPRLLRGFIDYNLDPDTPVNDKQAEAVQIKERLCGVLSDIFGGRFDPARAQLEQIGTELSGNPIFDYAFKERYVDIHWLANETKRSEKLTERINELKAERPDHFVMIGHSSYRQGFTIKEAVGLPVYAIRYSRQLKSDGEQQLPLFEGEGDHVKNLFEGKKVLIFDESRSGGGTLDNSARLLLKEVPGINRLMLSCTYSQQYVRERECNIWDYEPKKEVLL